MIASRSGYKAIQTITLVEVKPLLDGAKAVADAAPVGMFVATLGQTTDLALECPARPRQRDKRGYHLETKQGDLLRVEIRHRMKSSCKGFWPYSANPCRRLRGRNGVWLVGMSRQSGTSRRSPQYNLRLEAVAAAGRPRHEALAQRVKGLCSRAQARPSAKRSWK